MGAGFPCGHFPCGEGNDKFPRKLIPTTNNPHLDGVTIVYKDCSFKHNFFTTRHLLLEVLIKIQTEYPNPTKIRLEIPSNIKYADPLVIKHTFDNESETKFKINEENIKEYFNNSEEEYVCWSGPEIIQILRDDEHKSTKLFMKNFCLNNDLDSISHEDFFKFILKNKFEKIKYFNLQSVKISVEPKSGNDIMIKFKFVDYKTKELTDVLATTNVCITNYV